MRKISRRRFLDTAAVGALAPFGLALAADGPPPLRSAMVVEKLRDTPCWIVPVDPKAPGVDDVKVHRTWEGLRWQSSIVNTGRHPVRIHEVVVFHIDHGLPPATQLYGESFQMLSQTVGTLGAPIDLGYSELKHYKLPQPADATVVTGLLTLTPPGEPTILMAYTSCRRFIGRFYVRPGSVDVVVDTEGLTIAPGEKWELEELQFARGPNRPKLLADLAERINHNHPPLRVPKPPTGWCSWYCFGPRVTAQQVRDNLDVIARRVPTLKYVQIDDGYQPAMGDWLETGKAFGGDVTGVLKDIRARGFEPAIWIAPFIAQKDSQIFRQQPEWFVKGDDGAPLPSDKVTYGGWRFGPWYALDGTHPGAQKHLETLVRTMRREWGCTYFKLDANYWGALPGGRFHDPQATRITAYRQGMQAILKGAEDAFLLGCNHPIWPSFGLIHGSRSSGDVHRTWDTISHVNRQALQRNWQNGRLWWNDPDAAVLTGKLSDDEIQLHASAIYASGGMVLSGDDLTKIPDARLAMLKKLLPPGTTAADFTDESLRLGTIDRAGVRTFCLFNWSDARQSLTVPLPKPVHVTDFWSGADLGRREGGFTVKDMPPHSARLLVCRPG